MGYRLTGIEQETTINYNNAEDTAEISTCHSALINKLRNHAKTNSDCVLTSSDEYGEIWSVPKKWIKVSPPRKVSDEQRKAAGKRLKEYRENKTNAETE